MNTTQWVKEIQVTWIENYKEKTMKISAPVCQMKFTHVEDDGKIVHRLIVDGFKHSFRVSEEEYQRFCKEVEA